MGQSFRIALALGNVAAAIALAAFHPACSSPDAASKDGIQLATPPASVYEDIGAASPETQIRALVGFPLRSKDELTHTIASLYDSSSGDHRKYLSADDFVDRFGPPVDDLDRAQGWLESQGFKVLRRSTNRLMLEFSGDVATFDSAFDTDIHIFVRSAEGGTQTLSSVLAPVKKLAEPDAFSGSNGVLTVDFAPEPGQLSPEGKSNVAPPEDPASALDPKTVARAYGFDALANEPGGDGAGATIGLVVGESFKLGDVKSFWKQFGVTHDDPQTKNTMEPPTGRVVETTLDVEWAGAFASKAKIIVYQAPDIRETSLLFTFNEAIGLAEANVISDSFGHRETSVSKRVAMQYDASATMAAALGITVVAATGDSNGIDVPSVCPHVTAVGGTSLVAAGDGFAETTWQKTGAGNSKYFAMPEWQKIAGTAKGRSVADVALNAESRYWVLYLNDWDRRRGTSFSAPIFASMIAAIDGWRLAHGKPALGFLNTDLYANGDVQNTFRDITLGASDQYAASTGWDNASGWGAPNALSLAHALP